VLLDSDRRGYVYLGALVADENPAPPHELVDPELLVLRMTQARGEDAGLRALPACESPDEVFRELVVADDGTLYQLCPGPAGVEIRAYAW
jgi:hypothetical protein